MNLEPLTNQEPGNHNLPDPSPTDHSSDAIEVVEADRPDQQEDDTNLSAYLDNGYDYQTLKRGDIRNGVVIDINDHGLVVDVGYKREGFVPAEDLTRLDEDVRAGIAVDSNVSVFVLRPENRDGHPILSIHQAGLYKDWIEAEQMMEDGGLYEGEVAGYNRGGIIVKFGKIRGFVPASQIVGLPRRLREDQRRQRMEAMIGQKIGLKIIEVDRRRRRLIFSQRRALRAWQEKQRNNVMAELVKGETRRGKVTSITNFGAFVDLGGADGLIHVSELSWGRVDNPRQVLKVGDELDVYVLDVDRQRKRIALSLKKLQPDPWTIVDDHYQTGQLVEGRVTRVLDFGAFVELDLGIEGLLHSSEMIGTPELPPSDIVHPGEKLLVKIIRIESRRRRLALSARQVRKSEWERWIAEQQTAHEAEEAKAREEAARVREAEALEQAAPVQETEASISEQVEVEREAESATEAEAIAPEEEAPVGKVVEEAAPASEPEMEEAIPSETEKVAPDEGTDVDSGIQAPEVADGAQAAD
jgi:small subunit ribosomal protein S1